LEGFSLLSLTAYISSNPRPVPGRWQLCGGLPHRPIDMPSPFRGRFAAVWLLILVGLSLRAWSQPASDTAAPAGTQMKVSLLVQPALGEVQRAITGLNIPRWKAPSEVKNATQQNAVSIQRDLADTLPGLLSQADALPGAVSPSFSVYRNMDALYDVLLRVYGTASLAAPQNEADSLFSALQKLEAARAQLGDAILSASQEHEAQLLKLQADLKAAVAAQPPPPPPKTAVVDDGPAPTVKKKKKPAPKAPATAPAPPSGQSH